MILMHFREKNIYLDVSGLQLQLVNNYGMV